MQLVGGGGRKCGMLMQNKSIDVNCVFEKFRRVPRVWFDVQPGRRSSDLRTERMQDGAETVNDKV